MPKLAPPIERAIKSGVLKNEKLAPGVARAINRAADKYKWGSKGPK